MPTAPPALRAVDRRLVWPALAWCLMVWFSIVYLGEHHLVDALAGTGGAALAWAVMNRLAAPRVGALREAGMAAGG